ncbi:hypothetical protein HDV01_000622 [Terramyces sp. JEL0728]|nr:hypothetical protein HDV01_000622 [Terramyces sp. JEL0728]
MAGELKIETEEVPQGSTHVLVTPEAPPRASRELQAGESVLRRRNAAPDVSNVAEGYIFWEARRLWGTLFAHTRNLARVTWIAVRHEGKKELLDKYANINLLLAFAVACKHYLRFEKGHHYEDLHHLLVHLPEFRPGQYHSEGDNLPLELTFYISSYNNRCRAKENPFGYDDNDLRMDLFCQKLKAELEQLVDSPNSISVDDWTVPVDIANFGKMRSVSDRK